MGVPWRSTRRCPSLRMSPNPLGGGPSGGMIGQTGVVVQRRRASIRVVVCSSRLLLCVLGT